MSRRSFEGWFSTFRDTLDDYEDYRIDYQKAQLKLASLKIEICLLNSLMNSKNIEKEFEELAKNYPPSA